MNKKIKKTITDVFGNLNDILKFSPSDLAIVAGLPGTGKTAFQLSVVHDAALQGNRVVFFSLEMTEEEITQRLLANETGIDLDRIQTGQLSKEEWHKFNDATEKFEKLQIFVDDTPAITAMQIEARCRQLTMQHGPLDLVVVDYLQIMSAGTKTFNRTEEVGVISRSLKRVAQSLKVPFLVGAQLNRFEDGMYNRRPRLSDLQDDIKVSANTIIFLYTEDTEEEFRSKLIAPMNLIVHRNGVSVDANAIFYKATTKFQ